MIDFSAKQIDLLKVFDIKTYYCDATRPDMLHAAGIDEAKLLVIAIDDKEKITQLVHYMAHPHPHVHILARAIDRNHVYDLWHAGCRDIIRETYDASLRMGKSAFQALGVSNQNAQDMLQAFNDMDRQEC